MRDSVLHIKTWAADMATAHELGGRKMEVKVIGETDPNYPYAKDNGVGGFIALMDGGGGMGVSANGEFNFGAEGQRGIGMKIAEIVDIPDQSPVLEVGYGTNTFLAEGVRDGLGSEVVLLDVYASEDIGVQDCRGKVVVVGQHAEKMVIAQGNFADIDAAESDLARNKFGLIMFNGSWVSGGNNLTVVEDIDAKFHQQNETEANSSDRKKFHEREFRKVLKKARNHLAPGGTIYLASSRFALHGDGHSFSQLLEEKLYFANAIEMLKTMGAKEITLVGVGNECIKEWAKQNLEDPELQLTRFTETFFELFHGTTMGPKMSLNRKDGTVISALEIGEMCEDREEMRRIMMLPKFGEQMKPFIEEKERQIMEIINKLGGGIDQLPDSIRGNLVSDRRIAKIKEKLAAVVPTNLARIDAIAVKF